MNLSVKFPESPIVIWTGYDFWFYTDIIWAFSWLKKVAKLEPFYKRDLPKLELILKAFGLRMLVLERNEKFIEKSMRFSKDDKDEDWADVFISKDNKYLDMVSKIYEKPKSKSSELAIWKLLWYPDCCIRSFLENDYKDDMTMNVRLRGITIWQLDWRLNNTLSQYRLTPFFPCSYNCENAIIYAENQFKSLKCPIDLERILNSVVLYRNFWEYIILPDWRISGWKLEFNEISLSEKLQKIGERFISGKKDYAINNDSVMIWGESFFIFDFINKPKL
jgi:hypothetical protein